MSRGLRARLAKLEGDDGGECRGCGFAPGDIRRIWFTSSPPPHEGPGPPPPREERPLPDDPKDAPRCEVCGDLAAITFIEDFEGDDGPDRPAADH
jgi:hypothetical protein